MVCDREGTRRGVKRRMLVMLPLQTYEVSATLHISRIWPPILASALSQKQCKENSTFFLSQSRGGGGRGCPQFLQGTWLLRRQPWLRSL